MTVIVRKYPDGIFTRQTFVDALGLSATSGGPDHKLASLRQYKLATRTSDQQYKVTDLATTIVNETIVRSKVIEQAVRNVELWDKLLNTIGKEFTDEAFVSAFGAITGIPEPEIGIELAGLKYAYREDMDCINKNPPYSTWSTKVGKPRKSQDGPESGLQNQTTTTSQSSMIKGYKVSIDYGGFQIVVTDEPTYLVALQMLQAVKMDLEAQGVCFSTTNKGAPSIGS